MVYICVMKRVWKCDFCTHTNIEIGCGNKLFNKSNAETFIRKEFQSLVNTSDITWLESEQTIKEIRKNKLAQLKERMNG